MENKKNKKKSPFVSQENGGLEVISPMENLSSSQLIIENDNDNDSINISKEKIQVKKSGNLVIGSLNLALDPIRRRNERYYKNNFWHIIADLFLVLLILTLVFSLFYINNWRNDEKIQLNIQNNNQEIVSGSLNSFELTYKSEIKTTKSKVHLSLPENIIIESVSPSNLFSKETNSFDLGLLDAGSSGKIKINAFIFGKKDAQQKIGFTFNCEQCGRKGFTKSLFYNIEKSIIDMDLSLPEIAHTNSEFDSFINIKNNSNQDINNIKIQLGSDIVIRDSDFKFEHSYIIIDKLSSLENKKIEFTAEVNKEAVINIKPIIELSILDEKFQFSEKSFSLNVKKPSFNLVIDTDKKIANHNEEISYTIKIKNEEKVSLKNIKINLFSANNNFSLNAVKLIGNLKNARLLDKTISINDLLADEELIINITASFSGRKIIANQELAIRAETEYEIDNHIIKYKSNSKETKLNSIFRATASAYYYSPQGDQLGVGPLPPAINMATNYWIFLEFDNEGNSLRDLVLSAELAENVYFSDNKRVLDGALNYAEIGKRLIWQISEISSGNSKQRANFEITLIPESDDLGKTLELLKNIKISAIDNFTNQEISTSIGNINTDLKNDKFSSGKGKVINLR